MNRILELGLRAWAATQILAAIAWISRPGTSAFPSWLLELLGPTLLNGLFTGPIVGAHLTEDATQGEILDLMTRINPTTDGAVSGAYGDINIGWSVQFSTLGSPHSWMWIVLHVVPLVAMACMWWLLADAVRDGRRQTVFTERNRRRLVGAGVVLLFGAPLLSAVTWWFYGAVADSSQIAERVSVPEYSLAQLPWTAMATGVALIALGQVWKRGTTLENDLGGLV